MQKIFKMTIFSEKYVLTNSQTSVKINIVAKAQLAKERAAMKIDIYCPICAAAGIKRKLMEADAEAKGVVFPYCKGCKKNVKIELQGNKA